MLRILLSGILALIFALAGALSGTSAAAGQHGCDDASARNWIDEALASWRRVVADELRLEPRALPWIVAFDDTCVWNVNAEPGATAPRPSRHEGTVRLPDGQALPVTLATFVAPYGPERRPFLVTALPPVWRAQKRLASEPRLPILVRSVFMHEMTHTLQSRALGTRIDAIAEQHALTDLTDDVIQDRFAKVPGFKEAYERERDLFFAAAAASAPARRAELGGQALASMIERRSRYLSGASAHFAELEDVFLIMEGAANWAAYRSARLDGVDHRAALELIRRDGRRWSQDEGLALFLFLEAAGSNWRADVFSEAPSSVVDLVRIALQPRR